MAKPHYSKEPYVVTALGGVGGGMEFIAGEGAPSDETGNDGDVYLDTSSGDLYKKGNGAWTMLMNLVGPQGPQGEPGQQGEQGPPGADGQDGRGIANITYDGDTSEFVFHMTDDTEIRVAVPPVE